MSELSPLKYFRWIGIFIRWSDITNIATFIRWSDRTNIATEYGIYCDNAYLAALSITYYFVGYALGTTMLGVSADK